MKNIILIGGGGHCKSCIDVIEMEKKYKIYGLIDNNTNKSVLNYKVLGTDNKLKKIYKKKLYALITIGQIKNLNMRESLFNKVLLCGFKFPKIISPLAYVSKHAKIGEGTIVMHGAIINAGAVIGKNCIINSKSLIEHDTNIGNHCHIATGSTINGGVTIKSNCFIGSRTVIKQDLKIGKNCFLNANIFLQKNLKDKSKVLR